MLKDRRIAGSVMADGQQRVNFRAVNGLSEQIASHLETQIVAGELRSGQRIQESKVVQELAVSRGPVREALLILSRRRLIQLFPRRGAIVMPLNAALVRSLSQALELLMREVLRDQAGRWTELKGRQLDDVAAQSRAQYGLTNPFCILKFLAKDHPNPVYGDVISDLLPTLDRVFAKLSRTHPSCARYLKELVMHDLVPALEAGSLDGVTRVNGALCRGVERKYLESLERTS